MPRIDGDAVRDDEPRRSAGKGPRWRDVAVGIERNDELRRRCRALPATAIQQEIFALVEQFSCGAPASDDRTAIRLRRTP